MSLAAISGARIPHLTGDPLYGDVLLLLNGQNGLTKDSSIYDRAMTAVGTVAINSAKTLNGLPTYEKPYGGGSTDQYLQLTVSDAWVAGNCATGEWCLEVYLNPTTAGLDQRLCGIGPLYLGWYGDESIEGTCTNLGSSSYSANSGAGLLPIGTWGHLAWIRDNTTDPLFSVLRLFFNGAEVASVGGIAKSGSLGGTGFGRPMGFTSSSQGFSSGGLRLTLGRRYLTNVEGQPVNSFTPSPYPFWAP